MTNCVHVGPEKMKLRVRCPNIGGGNEYAAIHECAHPDRQRTGRNGEPRVAHCLPGWLGPWIMPDQASEASRFAICAECPLAVPGG